MPLEAARLDSEAVGPEDPASLQRILTEHMKILNKKPVLVAVEDLIEHPRNPRDGDVGAIVESIKENGFYGFLVAQESTGFVLVGNHRLKAARALEFKKLPAVYIDVDDARALKIMLADNRTNDLADYRYADLADLLKEMLAEGETLEGTGYDESALDEMLHDLEGVNFFGEMQTAVLKTRIDNEVDHFTVTFLFPKEHEDLILGAIKADGKPALSQKIIDLCQSAEAK